MPEANLLNYIGAVAGIGGAIMGYISFRRSGKMKALDLRLELRKADHDLRDTVKGFAPLLDQAMNSHKNVSAAIGQYNSGAFKQWVSEWEESQKEILALENNLPDPDTDYQGLGYAALETRLVAVHAMQSQAAHIRDKYLAVLESHDKEREHLKANMHGSITRGH
ncbi:MAG: hypothetical protein ABI728_13140 [Betaproteobacteria bacterium]